MICQLGKWSTLFQVFATFEMVPQMPIVYDVKDAIVYDVTDLQGNFQKRDLLNGNCSKQSTLLKRWNTTKQINCK